MKQLLIEGIKNKMPEILFDHTNGQLAISGISSGENPRNLYTQALEWLSEYEKAPRKETALTIKIAYFNTTSAKYILDILENVADMDSNSTNVQIKWICEKDDEDMIDAVRNFSEILSFPIAIEEAE